MELTFLGNGAAFTTDFDNTSAYFIEKQELFLIDCGETVFKKLLRLHLLENISKVHLFITHLHSDHVGSVPSLALYSFSVLGEKLHIYTSFDCKYLYSLKEFLRATGSFQACSFHLLDELSHHYQSFSSVSFIETKHVSELNCYSILFDTSLGLLFYSGDSNDINLLLSITSNDHFNLAYVDTTSSTLPNQPHLSIYSLVDRIPQSIRKQIYCMHFNDSNCIQLAEEFGFSVVDTI